MDGNAEEIHKLIQAERRRIKEIRGKKFMQEYRGSLKEHLTKRFLGIPYSRTILYSLYLLSVIVISIVDQVLSNDSLNIRIYEFTSYIFSTILLIVIVFLIPNTVPTVLVKRYEFPKDIRRNQRLKQTHRIMILIIWILLGMVYWLRTIEYFIVEIIGLFTILLMYGIGTAFFIMNLTTDKSVAFKMDWHNFFIENHFIDTINKSQLKNLLKFMIQSRTIKTLTLKYMVELFEDGKTIKDLKKEFENEEEKKKLKSKDLEAQVMYEIISCQPEFRWINIVLVRFTRMIEYFIVPNVSVNLRNEDSHRLFIALYKNEERIVDQFIECLCKLNLGSFLDFYFEFHNLMQLLRSDNLERPIDSFIFNDNLTFLRKIRNFVSRLLNNSIFKDLLAGSLLIFITYQIAKLIT